MSAYKLKLHYRVLLFVIILVWFLGIFFEYAVHINHHLIIFLPLIKKSYSLVCHQDPHKLINLFGHNSLTCARCVGIYLGILSISFLALFIGELKLPHNKFLLIGSIPIIFDVLFTTFKLYEYSRIVALSTGLLFGSILFLYLYNSLKAFYKEIKSLREN